MLDSAVNSVIFTAVVSLHLHSMTTEGEQQDKNDELSKTDKSRIFYVA